MSREEAARRIALQNSQADKVKQADVVIENDGDVVQTRAQVERAWIKPATEAQRVFATDYTGEVCRGELSGRPSTPGYTLSGDLVGCPTKLLLADNAVMITIIHVMICRMPATNRSYSVVTRLSTSDPAISVIIVQCQCVLCGGLRRRLLCR